MKPSERRGFRILVTTLFSLAAHGCVIGVIDVDDGHGSQDEEATLLFTRTVPVSGQVGLRVTGLNGNIQVFAVDGAQEVTIQARKRVRSHSVADAEAHLSRIQVLAQATPYEVRVETIHHGGSDGRSYSVDYEIFVPEAFHAAGSLANGNTVVEDLKSSVDVEVGNGNVILRRVEGCAWVALGNGNLDASMILPYDGEIVFSVGNGSAVLTVPQDVSAELKARVGVGTITVSGLSLVDPVSGPNTFRSILGSGEGLIDLTVGNGNIRVNGG